MRVFKTTIVLYTDTATDGYALGTLAGLVEEGDALCESARCELVANAELPPSLVAYFNGEVDITEVTFPNQEE